MKEELYVYTKSGERKELHLGAESGITLKWVSNIFNSLDKVNCSYSYTFKVPVTRHNMEVLDLAEDMRHTSGMTHRKVKADFIQNGIPLFTNANLYINQVSGGNYQCVFTFNVIDGLQKLKDDACNLTEIGDKLKEIGIDAGGLVDWGNGYIQGDPIPDRNTPASDDAVMIGNKSRFNNENEVMWPLYCAGIAYSGQETTRCSPPVVPIRYLLSKIGQLYDISFNLTTARNTVEELNAFKEDEIFEGDNLLSFGCLPLVGTEQTETQKKNEGLSYGYVITLLSGRKFGISNLVSFAQMPSYGKNDLLFPTYMKVFGTFGSFIDYGMPSADDIHNYLRTSAPTENADLWRYGGVCCACEVEMRGTIYVRTNVELKYDSDTGKATDETLLKMKIWRLNHWRYLKRVAIWNLRFDVNYWTSKEDQSIEPPEGIALEHGSTYAQSRYDENENFLYTEYIFCFDPDYGFDPITFGIEWSDNPERSPDVFHHYLFGFSDNAVIQECTIKSPIRFYPKASDCKKITHKVDLFKNLPDISCIDFLKSLYYMQGAFPTAAADGTIGAIPYVRLRDNIESGNVCDWSSKVIGTVESTPEDMSYKAGDFVQMNYYLTKWDDLDRTEEELEEEDDVYEDGYQCIESNNESLTEEQTVYTLPYYPPFIKNRKMPYRWVGNSMKFWELSDGEYTYGSAQPCFGILSSTWMRTLYTYDLTTWEVTESISAKNTEEQVSADKNVLWMDVINPFSKNNVNWQYLQEIVRDPITITEKFLLNEIDLRDLDFSKPVYLEKYNSYFAIVTVQRDSKGVCKCELIKLPAA